MYSFITHSDIVAGYSSKGGILTIKHYPYLKKEITAFSKLVSLHTNRIEKEGLKSTHMSSSIRNYFFTTNGIATFHLPFDQGSGCVDDI